MEIKSTIRDITLTLTRQLGSGFLQLLIVMLIAKQYGPEGNGTYSMAILVPFLLATFLNLGIGSSIVYHVSSKKVSLKYAYVYVKNIFSFLMFFGLAVGGGAIYFGGSFLFNSVDTSLLYLSLSLFPLLLFQEMVSCFFQSMQRFREFSFILMVQPVILFLSVVFFELMGIGNIHVVVAMHLVSVLVTLFLSWSKLKGYIKEEDEEYENERSYSKGIIIYGFKSHLSNVVSFFNYRADVFLINFFLGPVFLGVYVLSVQITEKLWLISSAVSTVITPKIALVSNSISETTKITPFMCRLVLTLTLVSSLFLYLLTDILVLHFFGEEYIEVLSVMLVLIPGVLIWSGSRVISSDLAAHGILKINLYASIAVLAINVIGNIALIPDYGLLGGATATTASYIFDFLVKSLYYSRVRAVPIIDLVLIKRNDLAALLSLFGRRSGR